VVPTVIKGLHVALAYHDDPGVRPMSDVDVVIAPEQVRAAESALTAAGFIPLSAPRTPYKRDWTPRAMDRRLFSIDDPDARNPWQLEVHASFDRGFASAVHMRLDSERGNTAPFSLDGRTLRAPAQPLLLLTLAGQLSSEMESMRLMRLMDLVTVIRRDVAHGVLDWGAVEAAMQRIRAASFIYPALALAEQLAPGTVDAHVLDVARASSTRIVRSVTRRLAPSGGYADETSMMQLVMWADTPYTFVKVVLHRVRDLVTSPYRWRSLARRIARGAFHLRPRPEGGGESVTHSPEASTSPS
jgi:hypothetical protein